MTTQHIELEPKPSSFLAEIKRLQAENAKLRAALEKIQSFSTWQSTDTTYLQDIVYLQDLAEAALK